MKNSMARSSMEKSDGHARPTANVLLMNPTPPIGPLCDGKQARLVRSLPVNKPTHVWRTLQTFTAAPGHKIRTETRPPTPPTVNAPLPHADACRQTSSISRPPTAPDHQNPPRNTQPVILVAFSAVNISHRTQHAYRNQRIHTFREPGPSADQTSQTARLSHLPQTLPRHIFTVAPLRPFTAAGRRRPCRPSWRTTRAAEAPRWPLPLLILTTSHESPAAKMWKWRSSSAS